MRGYLGLACRQGLKLRLNLWALICLGLLNRDAGPKVMVPTMKTSFCAEDGFSVFVLGVKIARTWKTKSGYPIWLLKFRLQGLHFQFTNFIPRKPQSTILQRSSGMEDSPKFERPRNQSNCFQKAEFWVCVFFSYPSLSKHPSPRSALPVEKCPLGATGEG